MRGILTPGVRPRKHIIRASAKNIVTTATRQRKRQASVHRQSCEVSLPYSRIKTASGSGDDYLDLANTMLHVQVKVSRAEGDDIDLADHVGPVNNWLHASRRPPERYSNDLFNQHV